MRHTASQPAAIASLAEEVATTAERVWTHIASAMALGRHPPAAVLFCERDLWRWHHVLRQLAASGTSPPAAGTSPRQVAVVLLVELATARDPDLVAQQLIDTKGPTGDGWRVLHRSVHPDPAALFGFGPARRAADEPGPQRSPAHPRRRRASPPHRANERKQAQ